VSDTYISTALPLSPSLAAEAAKDWHRNLIPLWAGSRFAKVDRRMWLRRELAPQSCDETQLVRAFGILWVHALPVRIEFEVSAWSTTSSALSLRPRALHSVAATASFMSVGMCALGKIADSLLLNTIGNSAPLLGDIEHHGRQVPLEPLRLNLQSRPLVLSDPTANLVTT
jgi:hypothetical protein